MHRNASSHIHDELLQKDIYFTATKQPKYESTQKTMNVCRRWKILYHKDDNLEHIVYQASVIDTPSGTYFETWNKGEGLIGSWQWTNETQNMIYLIHQGNTSCEDEYIFDIHELSSVCP